MLISLGRWGDERKGKKWAERNIGCERIFICLDPLLGQSVAVLQQIDGGWSDCARVWTGLQLSGAFWGVVGIRTSRPYGERAKSSVTSVPSIICSAFQAEALMSDGHGHAEPIWLPPTIPPNTHLCISISHLNESVFIKSAEFVFLFVFFFYIF